MFQAPAQLPLQRGLGQQPLLGRLQDHRQPLVHRQQNRHLRVPAQVFQAPAPLPAQPGLGQQPPFPDQQPLLGRQQPQFPDQQPLLDRQQPPFPDQQLLLGLQQPTFPDQQPLLGPQQPPIPDQQDHPPPKRFRYQEDLNVELPQSQLAQIHHPPTLPTLPLPQQAATKDPPADLQTQIRGYERLLELQQRVIQLQQQVQHGLPAMSPPVAMSSPAGQSAQLARLPVLNVSPIQIRPTPNIVTPPNRSTVISYSTESSASVCLDSSVLARRLQSSPVLAELHAVSPEDEDDPLEGCSRTYQ